MWESNRGLLLLVLFLLLYSQLLAQDFLSFPPFDSTKTYQVPGAQLEQLRLAWIEQVRDLLILEKQVEELKITLSESGIFFGTYKTEMEAALRQALAGKEFYTMAALVGFGLFVGSLICNIVIP